MSEVYIPITDIRCDNSQWSIRTWSDRLPIIPFVENQAILELILSRIAIPTVYFWEDRKCNYENIYNGEYIYAVLNYMRDQYVFKPFNGYFDDIAGKKFSELPAKYQAKFYHADYNIQIMDARTPIEGRLLLERLKVMK